MNTTESTCTHEWVEGETYRTDIAYTKDCFREIKSRYVICSKETIVRNALIQELTCKHCGAVSRGWSRGGFEE